MSDNDASNSRSKQTGNDIVTTGIFRLSPASFDLAEHWWNIADKSTCGQLEYEIWQTDESAGESATSHDKDKLDATASQLLSSQEHDMYRTTPMHDRRRREWLAGRAVAKQAVRKLLARCRGLQVAPVDVAILPDDRGRPCIVQGCIPGISTMPEISIAHTRGMAVAVAVDGIPGIRVGIDIERYHQLEEGFARRAFAPAEQHWLTGLTGKAANELMLQLWCAKEAAAKALGLGFAGKPQTYVVNQFDPANGYALVEYTEEQPMPKPVPVTTSVENGLIVALAYRKATHLAQSIGVP